MQNHKIKSEFYLALNAVATEKGISVEEVLDSIRAAVLAAYLKDTHQEDKESFAVSLDSNSGEMRLMDGEKDITPPGFGRIATSTARQVITLKIRDAEKRHITSHYLDMVGTLVRGRVVRTEGKHWLVDLGKANGIVLKEDQFEGDHLRPSSSGQFYLREIRDDGHGAAQILLSRSHPNFVAELFKREVPELASGALKIEAIVRGAGIRTKIAVKSEQTGVDPIGACVGQKGIRVKAVNEELGDEKIDIIQYNSDPKIFIKDAMLPAEIVKLEINKAEHSAKVYVAPEQASIAIGRVGTNVRLASELSGYHLEVIELPANDTAQKAPTQATSDQTDESNSSKE